MSMASWHSGIELVIATLCFVNAFLAYRRYQQVPLGLNALWCVAMGVVGVLVSIHAVLSFLRPELVTYWVPWTWAVAHATLAIMLLAGVRYANAPGEKVWAPSLLLGILFSASLFPFGSAFSFVYTDSLVKRPLDFILMWMWIGLLIVFMKKPLARLQLPGGVTHVFLALGVASHAIMAFGSKSSLDPAFMVSHGVKALEIGAWTACAFLEIRAAKADGGLAEVIAHRVEHELEKDRSGEDLSELRKLVRGYIPRASSITRRRTPRLYKDD